MEVTGKIILALPEQSGVSKSGNNWHKREYVLETQENFPRKIFFSFFGDKADQYPLSVGQVIRLSFDIDSREYNGRWFTSINAWKAEDASQAAPAAPAQGFPTPGAPQGFPSAPAAPAATAAPGYAAPAAPGYAAPAAPAAPQGFPAAPAATPNDDLPF